jgi:enamine deaminase RidA (YjgF/YER057c/UK114 family)
MMRGLAAGEFLFTRELEAEGSNLREQTKNVLDATGELLQSQGLTFRNVVKVQVYLKDMRDYVEFNNEYAKRMGDQPPPRSTVEIPGFVNHECRVAFGVIGCKSDNIEIFKAKNVNPSPGPLYDGALVEPYLFTREMCGLGAGVKEQIADGFSSMEKILRAKDANMHDTALVFAYLTEIGDFSTLMEFYTRKFDRRLPPLSIAAVTCLPHRDSAFKIGGVAAVGCETSSIKLGNLKDSYANMTDVTIIKNLAFSRELLGIGSNTEEQISSLTFGVKELLNELGSDKKRIVNLRVHLTDLSIYDRLLKRLDGVLGGVDFPTSQVIVKGLPRNAQAGLSATFYV